MMDAPNIHRRADSSWVRIGAGRAKGMSIKKILFDIHCNRGARRQDGSMLTRGKFAVGGVAFAPAPFGVNAATRCQRMNV
jgi:hypothetical protein